MHTIKTPLLAALSLAISVPAAGLGAEPNGAIPLPHGGTVLCCSISPDGKSLATGCNDKLVRLWDIATGKERARIAGHNGAIKRVVFSPDGKRIVSIASNDRTVRTWDATTGRALWAMQGHGGEIHSLAISADGTKVASAGSDRRVCVADAATGRLVHIHATHTDAILAVAIAPDSRLVATGGKDRLLNLWQIGTGRQFYRKAGKDEISVLTFSPDGKLLALAGSDKVIRLFDMTALKEVRQLTGHQDLVRSLVFLPDGKTLLSGSQDRTIRVWEVASGKEIRLARRHRGAVTALAVTPDGRLIASASEDGSAIISSLAGLRDWKPKPIDLTTRQLEQLWVDLTRDDSRSVQAVWSLVAGGKHAVPFLRKHLKAVEGPVPARIAQLLEELDSDKFAVREKAFRQLEKLGKSVEQALNRQLRQTTSLEVRRRVKQLLEKLGPRAPRSPEQIRTTHAVDVLEQVGTPEAKQVLEKLASGEPGAELTEIAKAALKRLAR